MSKYRIVTVAYFSLLAAFGLVFLALSLAGFWGDLLAILNAVVSLVAWAAMTAFLIYAILIAVRVPSGDQGATATALRRHRRILLAAFILSLFSAYVFALLAFLNCGLAFVASWYHWIGLISTLLCLLGYLFMPRLVRACFDDQPLQSQPRSTGLWVSVGVLSFALAGIGWLVAFLILNDEVDAAAYRAGPSDYRLPYPAGESAWVVQGNNTGMNHTARQKFAWDLRRSCGTPVLAARDGTVTSITDSHSGRGDNNVIEVRHAGNEASRYFHIATGSAVVAVGDTVNQGDALAEVGTVGHSATGHIHFEVIDLTSQQTLPIRFADVADDDGIPRTFGTYTSGNN